MSTDKTTTARNRSQQGTTALETAIVLPVFFLLLFGAIDFGRIIWFDNAVGYAAAEGTRLATMVEPTDSEVIELVYQRLREQGISVEPTVTVENRTSGQMASVTVDVPVQFLVLPNWISTAASLTSVSATSTMPYSE